ncbi:phenylalanine 4-monooxygenase [Catenovulum sp. SM1970]|uniref:phenylalanine 4-monooxygenase n=1 Tax=Marinifaba aquimaris TaxID=2741323 RepID=UPI0015744B7D|nr:phenylalanine 4-monooxygenase [Marinifaba aquimaris]NTS75278.1 phenylalanine 4-monooxygenase [Marinifaba aquimaris]
MKSSAKYVAKPIDDAGYIEWTEQENATWQHLCERQHEQVKAYACEEYIRGLEALDLPQDRVPQLAEVDEVLLSTTGWSIAPVPALINFDHFFSLLANKKFPVATFIRTPQDMDYLQEPDIFHEIFGHCPMLTHPDFAHFTHIYGQLGKKANAKQRIYLARLYWFTVEFGLLQQQGERKIYGGGILSSPEETRYAMFSDKPRRCRFDIDNVLRTPYRIDELQPQYFEIETISALFELSKLDIMAHVDEAISLGLFDAEAISRVC